MTKKSQFGWLDKDDKAQLKKEVDWREEQLQNISLDEQIKLAGSPSALADRLEGNGLYSAVMRWVVEEQKRNEDARHRKGVKSARKYIKNKGGADNMISTSQGIVATTKPSVADPKEEGKKREQLKNETLLVLTPCSAPQRLDLDKYRAQERAKGIMNQRMATEGFNTLHSLMESVSSDPKIRAMRGQTPHEQHLETLLTRAEGEAIARGPMAAATRERNEAEAEIERAKQETENQKVILNAQQVILNAQRLANEQWAVRKQAQDAERKTDIEKRKVLFEEKKYKNEPQRKKAEALYQAFLNRQTAAYQARLTFQLDTIKNMREFDQNTQTRMVDILSKSAQYVKEYLTYTGKGKLTYEQIKIASDESIRSAQFALQYIPTMQIHILPTVGREDMLKAIKAGKVPNPIIPGAKWNKGGEVFTYGRDEEYIIDPYTGLMYYNKDHMQQKLKEKFENTVRNIPTPEGGGGNGLRGAMPPPPPPGANMPPAGKARSRGLNTAKPEEETNPGINE